MTTQSLEVGNARWIHYGSFVSVTVLAPSPAPHRKSSRKQVLTDMRRSEIIAAALKVFAKKGFHNTRAEDVAAQARIAKGTLYLYFDSKEAIYESALQFAIAELNALVDQRLRDASAPEERIRIFIDARLSFWGEQGELYRMILTVGREKKFRKQTAIILQRAVDTFKGILQEGVSSGKLKDCPLDPIAWAVMDLIRGANERRIDGVSELRTGQETEIILGIVLRYFA